MIYRLLALIFIAFGTATPALAQQDAGEFCAKAPQEMLAALDGQWKTSQGAGFARAGTMTFPLPPSRGETIKLKFDPDIGASILSGKNDQILMIAGSDEALKEVSKYLDKEETDGLFTRSTGCDWYALPIMIGSRTYELSGHFPGSDQAWQALAVPGTGIVVCIMKDGTVTMANVSTGEGCIVPDRDIVGDGEMNMTVIVKFQNPNLGTGIVLFEGLSDGITFSARAPITLTR